MVEIKKKLEAIMKHYYSKDQDHMNANEIRKLKLKIFPYLDKNDVSLDMSDRSIVQRELDLTTDSVLSENERADIADFFYSMRDCLSTHDNPSVDCKTTVSLNPVNLKPFYIRPYLTHGKEIKFAEAEMENLMKMGIVHRGSSEFISPIMLIKKSHSGSSLGTAPEYCLVVEFKYLNSHLPHVQFSYPEVKHILNKIGRLSTNIFSMVDLKAAFHSINLSEDLKHYTTCCASPGSPTYQFNRLLMGLKLSPSSGVHSWVIYCWNYLTISKNVSNV